MQQGALQAGCSAHGVWEPELGTGFVSSPGSALAAQLWAMHGHQSQLNSSDVGLKRAGIPCLTKTGAVKYCIDGNHAVHPCRWGRGTFSGVPRHVGSWHGALED